MILIRTFRALVGVVDYGVLVLDSVPAGLAPIQLPGSGLLDGLAARGALRPESLFYGQNPALP